VSTRADRQEARRLQPEYEPITRAEAQLARIAEPQCRAQQAAQKVASADAGTAGGGGLRNEAVRGAAASAREGAAALLRITGHDSVGEAQPAEAEDEEWEDPSVAISQLAGAVVVTWPVVHNSGWGVFSRNLLRQMLSSGRHTPLLTVPLEVRVCTCAYVCVHVRV
jgi:hypothetical protein